MLQSVDVGELSLRSYDGIAPADILEQLRSAAESLRGLRVLHLNATRYGGGVSELLLSVVPLLRDLGIEAEWQVITAEPEFFQVTKTIHNGLQGGAVELTPEDRAVYLATAELNASRLEGSWDVVVCHDPQPAALAQLARARGGRWIWRCHIDTSHPQPATWDFLRPLVAHYDGAIFTLRDFVPADFPVNPVDIIAPAIDPLSPKNLDLPPSLAHQLLNWVGVRLDHPLITQVARFDPWKDPMGVIAAYRLVREDFPNLQLALAGSMALDDPEGWEVYRQIREEARSDPLIHVFSNLTGVSNVEVNAFQRLSNVVVQKSVREGFGLVVSEALWKGTPVVAGRAGGIPLQMAGGVGGFLVESVEECAAAIVRLLREPGKAHELAEQGRQRVRERFLLPRLLRDEVLLLQRLASPSGTSAPGRP